MAEKNYELTIATDKDGGSITVTIKDIDYPLFKAVRELLITDIEKALRIIMKDIVIDEKEKAEVFKHMDSGNMVFMVSLEDGIGALIEPVRAILKKK
jgi:hypothetical protein